MSRSPGARVGPSLWALLTAALLAGPHAARAETGQEAFDRQDYAAAAELWRAEAARGSDAAEFGLGLIHDLGLGVPRSSAVALRWYLEAAGDGLAEAQFNVAVMLDAGIGAPRDPAAAATWYARAAANGNPRAQYNLGLLYEGGVGVARSLDVARAWHQAAAPVIPAAGDRLAALPPSPPASESRAPRPILGAVLEGADGASRAELVWTVEGGGGPFRVEVAPTTPGSDPRVVGLVLRRSATVVPLPPGTTALRWRVGRQGAADVAWSPWEDLPGDVAADDPAARTAERLVIYVNAGDEAARGFAAELSEVFGRDGVETTIAEAERPAPATSVEYSGASDAALAASVAAFLPSGSTVPPSRVAGGAGPVVLRLVGGPRPVPPVEGQAAGPGGPVSPPGPARPPGSPAGAPA